MRVPALRQTGPIDVSEWMPDAEFGVFPVGARAKEAVFAPDVVSTPVLVPGKRYLFKRSKESYPDQFWGEIIAYRIGCLLGVPVPPAFYAINSGTHVSAALIEWFYEAPELFVPGGDFLERLRPGYDRDVGTQHNLADIRILSLALRQNRMFMEDWRQWWVDALLFDALIGNTDRHQDNWGFIFEAKTSVEVRRRNRMAPLFDNGTALGNERFPSRVANWTDAKLEKYVARGTHHVKWALSDPIKGHFDLLMHALETWPPTVDIAHARLQFSENDLVECFQDLLQLTGPDALSQARFDFVVRLLIVRYRKIKSLF